MAVSWLDKIIAAPSSFSSSSSSPVSPEERQLYLYSENRPSPPQLETWLASSPNTNQHSPATTGSADFHGFNQVNAALLDDINTEAAHSSPAAAARHQALSLEGGRASPGNEGYERAAPAAPAHRSGGHQSTQAEREIARAAYTKHTIPSACSGEASTTS